MIYLFMAGEQNPSSKDGLEGWQWKEQRKDVQLSPVPWKLCPSWEEADSQPSVSLSAQTHPRAGTAGTLPSSRRHPAAFDQLTI